MTSDNTPGALLTVLGWLQPPPPGVCPVFAALCLSISFTSLSISNDTMENTEMELAELRLLLDFFLFF